MIDDTWHFVLWVAVTQKGDKTTWKSMSFPAGFCHSCGRRLTELGDTQTRRYFPGVFAPIDSVVDAVRSKRAISDALGEAQLSEAELDKRAARLADVRARQAADASAAGETGKNLDPADFNEHYGLDAESGAPS